MVPARTYDFQRFIDAQASVYDQVLRELRAGYKQGHWMWFVFPQIMGLGSSAMSVRFALSSVDEARAYLEHPLLGPRLKECVQIVVEVDGKSASELFGYPDDLKFHSSLTLFARAAPNEPLFRDALNKYFDNKMDKGTLTRI